MANMKQPTTIILCCVALSAIANASPEIPGAPQSKPIAIVNGTVHPISSKPLENATVLFSGGRIVAVGIAVDLPEGTTVVDAKDRHVYPGLFNTDGALGLIEINAVRATIDNREIGDFNPNVRAEVAINPDSELIPVTRAGGVLLNLTKPSGGTVAGTSAVLQLDGWTWEDMTLHAPTGMHLSWPSLSGGGYFDEEDEDRQKRSADKLREIEQYFEEASVYDRARTANPQLAVDLRWEAMRAVLSRRAPLIVDVDAAAEIQSVVAFASRRNLRLIISGGYDAAECATLLRDQDVPVILTGIYRLPRRRSDPYDHPFTLPERLRTANVKFCIAGSAKFDAANIRNLPQHAAMAAAFGLSREDALRAVTLSPAEILGVADRVGSLTEGKDATLIIANGDILEPATNVVAAYIQGREVDLANRHQRLYHKYQARPNR
jgi:imidazolonepropionase-like amidohydrolase